jgi:hypothetical protein
VLHKPQPSPQTFAASVGSSGGGQQQAAASSSSSKQQQQQQQPIASSGVDTPKKINGRDLEGSPNKMRKLKLKNGSKIHD